MNCVSGWVQAQPGFGREKRSALQTADRRTLTTGMQPASTISLRRNELEVSLQHQDRGTTALNR